MKIYNIVDIWSSHDSPERPEGLACSMQNDPTTSRTLQTRKNSSQQTQQSQHGRRHINHNNNNRNNSSGNNNKQQQQAATTKRNRAKELTGEMTVGFKQ
jgi:hypothetical protein